MTPLQYRLGGRFQRYAIYWTPQVHSGLASFGERWFGPAAETFGLDPDLAGRAVRNPARYGLHATLKAPFRLRGDLDEAALQQALDAFCAVRSAPSGGALVLASFQNYLGLVLRERTASIDWLAAECVTHFDRFRAPLDDTDRDRRAESSFTPVEREFFESFGYPYVLSQFRFHISLAGPLGPPELMKVSAALAPQLAESMTEPFEIEGITLLGERGDGHFESLSRHRLGRAPRAEPELQRRATAQP